MKFKMCLLMLTFTLRKLKYLNVSYTREKYWQPKVNLKVLKNGEIRIDLSFD